MGWSGGATVLGKLQVPGRPTNLAWSRARAYCAFSRYGWGGLDIFFSAAIFLSPSLWETARYRLKYCLKGPLSPKQPTNHSMIQNNLSTELYTGTFVIPTMFVTKGFAVKSNLLL